LSPAAGASAAPAPPAKTSSVPWIEVAGVPRWRKFAASALIGLAFAIGVAALALYAYLLWSDAPGFDNNSSRQFRGKLLVYFGLPLLILFGPVWAASWVAKRIDPNRSDD
jgi:hypothetical protein